MERTTPPPTRSYAAAVTEAGRDSNDDGALVDRSAEIDILAQAVDDLAVGHGRAVIIVGPPGIGKSALLDVTRELAGKAGHQVLEVRGTELTGDISFGAVRALFAGAERHSLGSADIDGAVRAVLDRIADPMNQAPGEYAALQALHRLTAQVADGRPLVMIADDAHWIDPTSLRYFAYLASAIGRQPILLIIATRPHADSARQAALEQLLSSSIVDILRPQPLVRAAADRLLTKRLGRTVDHTFAAACFRATAGNPLMVGQLATTVTAAGVAPTAANAGIVTELGSRSVRGYVDDRLALTTPAELAVLQSIAVLGDDAATEHIAALAECTSTALTTTLLTALATHGLLTGTSIVHPLIRAAIYDSIDPATRASLHRRAAGLLIEAGAGVESVAAHYLRAPNEVGTSGSAQDRAPAERSATSTVAVLRRAAAEAQHRGAPESALRYLRRGLAAVASGPEHDAMVLAAGRAALQVDLPNSLTYLTQSLQSSKEPAARFRLLGELFGALLLTGRIGAALELVRAELDRLPAVVASVENDADPYADLRCYLASGIAMVAINNAALPSSGELAGLAAMPTSAGLGGRTLDATLSMYQAFRANPEAIGRAERAVSDEVLLALDNGRGPRMMALDVLLVADRPQALGLLDAAVNRAIREGSLLAVSGSHAYRGRGLLLRGALAAAHRDATTAKWATGICGLQNRSFVAQVLADTCLAMGRLAEARATLEWSDVLAAPADRPFTYFALSSWASLERAAGRPERGLLLARLAGERFAAAGGINPAMVDWRYEAALCLQLLGNSVAAKDLTVENLSIAQQWGSPRSLGRAMRLAASMGDGSDSDRIELLDNAVALLRRTTARLELAECLVALGRLKSTAGFDGSNDLAEGRELAMRCGALPLVDQATTAQQLAEA